jgi:hypothetical protein
MPRELHVHSVPSAGENLRTAVEVVAIVAAGIWALYTFVYEQRIKPLSESPSFSVPTTVDQGPTVAGVAFLTIHKRLDNTGNVGIDIAAEAFSVYGETLDPHAAQRNIRTPDRDEVRADVERRPVKLLYSIAKLRTGALGGSATNFFVPPHSSGVEDYLVAVPVGKYPVVLIRRIDYIGKSPIAPKIPVRIVRTPLGGYDLTSPVLEGEYDSQVEYPIRP